MNPLNLSWPRPDTCEKKQPGNMLALRKTKLASDQVVF